MNIRLKRRDRNAKLPLRAYRGDAGFDLFVLKGQIVWPFCVANFDTGFNVKVPMGTWGQIKTRSSTLFKKRLIVLEGVIDQDYTGSLSVVVFNPTFLPRFVREGDRLGQLIIVPMVSDAAVVEVDALPNTPRGNRGFGSSDLQAQMRYGL